MKLTDLSPVWIVTGDGRRGMGVTFCCPCPTCRAATPVGEERGRRLFAMFSNPVDGGPPEPADDGPSPRWLRAGETFETLTLTPSIDASASGHWHGFITNGELT